MGLNLSRNNTVSNSVSRIVKAAAFGVSLLFAHPLLDGCMSATEQRLMVEGTIRRGVSQSALSGSAGERAVRNWMSFRDSHEDLFDDAHERQLAEACARARLAPESFSTLLEAIHYTPPWDSRSPSLHRFNVPLPLPPHPAYLPRAMTVSIDPGEEVLFALGISNLSSPEDARAAAGALRFCGNPDTLRSLGQVIRTIVDGRHPSHREDRDSDRSYVVHSYQVRLLSISCSVPPEVNPSPYITLEINFTKNSESHTGSRFRD